MYVNESRFCVCAANFNKFTKYSKFLFYRVKGENLEASKYISTNYINTKCYAVNRMLCIIHLTLSD